METERRLFVGGLFSDVKEADLRQKFSRYGAIKDVEIRKKKEIDGKTDKTFAYINLNTTDGKMKTCIGVFNNTSWKGSKMTIQCAKEDFMKRLKEERENGFCVPDTKEKSILFNKPLEDNENVREFHMKGAVPGTPVTESKEWVVGKYGRVLPVLNLRGKDKRKISKIDPSKFCHNLKKVDGNVPVREAGVADVLTWEIRARESDIVKRQQGEFPKWQPPKKIRRRSEDKNKQISNGFKESSPNKDKDRNEDLEIIAIGTKTLPGNRTYQSGSSDSESDYESMKSSLSKSTEKLIPGTNDLDQKQNQQRMLIQSSETSVGEKCKRNTSIENVHSHKATRLLGGNLKQNVENSSFSPSDIDMDSEDDKSHSDKESVSSVDTDEIIVRNMKSRGTHSYSTVLTTAGSEMNEFYSGSVDRFNGSDDGDDEDDIDDDIDILDENDDLVALARKIETEYRNKFSHTENKKSMPKVKTTTTNSRTENEANINKRNVKDDIPLWKEGISNERVAISPNPGSVDNLTKHKMSNQDYNSDSGASSADTDEIINKSQKSQQTKNQIQTQDESISEFYGAAPDLMDENENSSEEDSVDSESDLPDTETDLRKLAHQIETEYKQSLKRSDRRVQGYSVNKEKSGDTNCQREKNLNRKNSPENKNLEDSMSQAADKKIMNYSKRYNDDDDDDDDDDDSDDSDDDHDSSDDDSSGDEDEKKDNDVIDKILSDHADLGKTEDDKSEGGIKKFRGTKHLFSTSYAASHMGDSSIPDKTRQVSSASSINTTRQESSTSLSVPETTSKVTSTSLSVPETTSKVTSTSSPSSSVDFQCTIKGLKSSASPESGGLINLPDKGRDTQNFPISPKDEERQKQESNKKRLASLKQKQQEFKVQQDKIKAALANVDRSLAPNKKIVFDSESEDEGKVVIDDQSNIPFNKDTGKIPEKSKKPVLFSESSSSDSEDRDSDEERFRIKPEYEGTSGKKLMHLQSKVGKDERFKLDERFLDSDDEEETNDQKDSGKDSEEGEKLKSLQILQEVVGKPLQIMSKNSTKKKFFRDMSALRYDPSREDHEHFEIKPLKAEVKTPDTMERKKEKKKKDKLSTEEPEVEAEPIPEVSKDRYFEVSTTFTDVFGKKSNDKQPSGTGFSFSSIF